METKFKALLILLLFTLPIISFFSCSDDDDDDTEPVSENSFTDDRDGEVYATVKIGDQTWMAENLRYKTSSGSWYYDNNSKNASTYGALYNYAAALTACPEGWHLPTDEEWKTLEIYLGMSEEDADKEGYRGDEESNRLKKSGDTGFNAEYGGIRTNDGSYYGMGSSTEYWTSTVHLKDNTSWSREIHDMNSRISREYNQIGTGLSVRCVKDE